MNLPKKRKQGQRKIPSDPEQAAKMQKMRDESAALWKKVGDSVARRKKP